MILTIIIVVAVLIATVSAAAFYVSNESSIPQSFSLAHSFTNTIARPHSSP
jgi:hypothetical protein